MRKLLALLLLAAPLFAQNPVTPPWPGAVPTETNFGVVYDRAYSSLTVAMTATATTITVADGSRFPNEPFWVTVGPITECSVGRPTTNCETIFITGVSGNVLTIGATGRQVTAACTGTATGGSNPTHATGDVVVQSIAACQYNALTSQVMSLAEGMFVTHATDCTLLTGTTPGQRCLELDADTTYIWDGAAWDLSGGSDALGTGDPGANGLMVRTALNTTVARAITGTASQVTVTNGDGVAGAPVISLPLNGGTDITADLEEETHASEHLENAADEILVENLGTACPENQIPKANATGGIVCATDETGGGSADMIGDFSSPPTLTLATGSVNVTAGGGAGAYLIDVEGGVASTDDWTAATCAAGVSFSVRAANDARSVVIVNASIPTPAAADLTLDQDGDIAFVVCQTANTPEVVLFKDESGSISVSGITGGSGGPTRLDFVEDGTAIADPVTAGRVRFGIDSTNKRMQIRAAGGSAKTTVYEADAQTLTNKSISVDQITGRTGSVTMTIDGGGATITTGNKKYIRVPYAGTITQVTTLADQSCSIVVDIWKDTYANYPPTDLDSITASAPPTITAALKSQDATLTGWTTSVAAGDILGFNVDSVTSCTWVTVQLDLNKS